LLYRSDLINQPVFTELRTKIGELNRLLIAIIRSAKANR
jgi:hypothetical protein